MSAPSSSVAFSRITTSPTERTPPGGRHPDALVRCNTADARAQACASTGPSTTELASTQPGAARGDHPRVSAPDGGSHGEKGELLQLLLLLLLLGCAQRLRRGWRDGTRSIVAVSCLECVRCRATCDTSAVLLFENVGCLCFPRVAIISRKTLRDTAQSFLFSKWSAKTSSGLFKSPAAETVISAGGMRLGAE